MTTFTANDKDIPTVPGTTRAQVAAVLALIAAQDCDEATKAMYADQLIDPDMLTAATVTPPRGSARRHRRARVEGTSAR